MLKNYLKIAWRNLTKNKVFSIINIMGLAIGLACSILILLWVQDELSYDKFHEKSGRIYRVLQDMPFTEKTTWAINQGPLAQALLDEVPEISKATRIAGAGWQIRYDENNLNEGGLHVDPAFLEVFDFEMLEGDVNTALEEPFSVILTEELAGKLFGEDDPIGKSINVYDQYEVLVTGLIADPPLNSHLQFEFLSTMKFAGEIGYSVDQWNNSTFTTYVLTSEDASMEVVNEKLKDILDDKPTLEEGAKLRLQPLADIHLSTGIDFDNGGTGNRQYVIIFFTSALFILVIACINFVNLSTAQASKRAREVGLRKAIGAFRNQLIKQFLMESILLAGIAFSMAIFLVEIILPSFNEFSGKFLEIQYLSSSYLIGFTSLLLLTGLLAGVYPSFVLSSYKPLKVLKGIQEKSSGKMGFRKALVIFQFTISVILMIGTLAVYKQVSFMNGKDLGFSKDNLVYIRLMGDQDQHLETIKNELVQHSNITSTTSTGVLSGFWFSNNQWSWEGKGEDQDILFRATFVDYDYFETFDMVLAEGRGFSRDFPSDTMGVVLNERAIELMELEDPVGKKLSPGDRDALNIVGIVKDFNFRSLHTEIEPLILILEPSMSNFLWFRMSGENVEETMAYAEATVKKLSPDHEFSYGFLDERMENTYRAEKKIGNILNAFSILALLVLCLGLFGLLGFTVSQRYKEISIRKVFGANASIVLTLLSREYIILIGIALAIAIPVSNYFITEWLNSFAFSINLGVSTFLIPAVVLITISMLIVIGQSYKATRINSADILRSE